MADKDGAFSGDENKDAIQKDQEVDSSVSASSDEQRDAEAVPQPKMPPMTSAGSGETTDEPFDDGSQTGGARSASDSVFVDGEGASSSTGGTLWANEWAFRHRKALIGLFGALGAILVILVLFATHIICFHEWDPATCTSPQTCEICGAQQGDPLGHEWTQATCTEPQTCSRCGEQQGAALGHEVGSWTVDAQATCSAPGSRHGHCSRCDQDVTESIAMVPHTPGEWQIKTPSTVSSSGTVIPGVKSVSCTVCGKEIETEAYSLQVTASQKNALRTAARYLDYTAFSHKGLVGQLEYEGYSSDDAVFAADNCGADWNAQAAKKAQQYLDYMSFSRSGLIDQLEYEGFTSEQAIYGVDKVYG